MRIRYRCTCGLRFEGRRHTDGSIHASEQPTDESVPEQPATCATCSAATAAHQEDPTR